jgi:hypothetical protein
MNNHTKWIQYICNPLMRKFGWNIVSIWDEADKFVEYQIRKYPENYKIVK